MRTRLRPYGWIGLVVAAIGGFACASQAWWQVPYTQGSVPISGGDGVGGLPQAVVAVLAAGVLLALTLRGWGRVVLAAGLVLVGATMAGVGLFAPLPSDDVIDQLVQQVTFEQTEPARRAWGGYGFAAAGLVAVIGAAFVLAAGRPPARTTDRFSRKAGTTAEVAPEDDALAVWRALDDGVDPTAEGDEQVSAISPQRPDVMRMGPTPDDTDPRDGGAEQPDEQQGQSDEQQGRHS